MTGHLAIILKNVSRTLYLSIRALPASMRPAFSCAYLLCRAADCAADCGNLSPEKRENILAAFAAFAEKGEPGLSSKISAAAPELSGDEKALFDAMPQVSELYRTLPEREQKLCRQVLWAVCAAMKTETALFDGQGDGPKAFATEADLLGYCAAVGGEPGLFWTRLAALHGGIKDSPELLSAGQDIGAALQICNILRDLPADLARGRCYLPLEDLKNAGLTPRNLLDPNSAAKLRPVIWKWSEMAADKLSSSEAYMCAIGASQFRLRAAVCWPVYWCLETLAAVLKADNLLSPSSRPRVTRARIYFTVVKTPAVLVSDTAYIKGFRLRRETLRGGGPPAAASHSNSIPLTRTSSPS